MSNLFKTNAHNLTDQTASCDHRPGKLTEKALMLIVAAHISMSSMHHLLETDQIIMDLLPFQSRLSNDVK